MIQSSLANSPEKSLIKRERAWVIIFAFVVILLTTIPYLVGYLQQGEEWQFTGFVFGVEDGNSYIAKMYTGASGDWLFRTPYTSMEQEGLVAFLPYILLGKLISPPDAHPQFVILYHVFRMIGILLAVMAIYDFLGFFIDDIRLKGWGLIIATLGGGLGWLLVLTGNEQRFGSLPLEFYSPETFGFLALYGIPHLALARASLLWGLLAFLRAFSEYEGVKLFDIIKIGFWWLLTAIAQPITAGVMGLVLGFYLLFLSGWQIWQKLRYNQAELTKWLNALRIVILSSIIPLPFLLYNLHRFSSDRFLRAWTSQNIIDSPHPLHYLLAYGLLLPFAFVGAIRLQKKFPWESWLPISWVVCFPILAYIPTNLQRRLPDGVWISITTLAISAFAYNKSLIQENRLSKYLYLLLFALPSTLLLLIGGAMTVNNPSPPVYRSADEVAVFKFLEENADPGEVVLASYQTGNALPAWAPVRVIIGHGPESVGLHDLKPRVDGFYRIGTSESDRLKFLDEHKVRYVFWGPEEKALGNWNPEQAVNLKNVYENAGYALFAVLP